ncbi:MAG: homospermidine synthase [Candidatus Margulisiibacteriota bacterium]|nr:MAG: homospermidine synthase [Candidatus Margulisbacteria bacterium GWD2_39_127]OGI04033.1 MAG: homospermidine synthase [Candidatus Margulisbacteria bacterium GWF2_38_17]OGI11975.1 MAG: homospermidine synthase [Candidatus Margulisbacteria bacterium GWE2_39_32]PZM80230.1 MAG: homospermidine synthase [Candidatus Margulisiibacteriota bacterium]HAR64232.1 homospermidine synthase [Candidatus Margulisiibacteriota bacterium]
MKKKFCGKILVIGCGGVSQCLLPMLVKHLDMPTEKIVIMDMVDNRSLVKGVLDAGAKYVIDKITKNNLQQKLSSYVGKGDMIIDLAWNIDCNEILEWCHDNDVRYVNTSVEQWDPYTDAENTHPVDRTLYVRHMKLRKMLSAWKEKGPSAVIDHGANPGLVSHFTKDALEDIAKKIISEKPKDSRVPELIKHLAAKNFNKIAQLTGVKVIHISERDTQIVDKPKGVNEFVNTWSIEGFYEEGIAPAEMGWGTHERSLPRGAHVHTHGPCNQICIAQMGMKTKVRSWVPCGEIVGMVIRHGEAFTISDYLTVWNDRKPEYRPTVHYAYCPSDGAVLSLHELEMRQFKMQDKLRILEDEIISGHEELGVLLMGHDFKCWWTGSILDINETRKLVPNQNSTTLQVACSVLAAMYWMIDNPYEGVNVPDDLPHKEILAVAKPYLGSYVSRPSDWDPLQNRQDLDLYSKFNKGVPMYTEDDRWQFTTFQIS